MDGVRPMTDTKCNLGHQMESCPNWREALCVCADQNRTTHQGHCYPACGCPESDDFPWAEFAADINSDPT